MGRTPPLKAIVMSGAGALPTYQARLARWAFSLPTTRCHGDGVGPTKIRHLPSRLSHCPCPAPPLRFRGIGSYKIEL
ncbi:hypothetical protein BD309DRAFT_961198 [Dichomitus squalens]|nr:hypothetical protein BD309DRAFT_961198 [Dichomitus squalens]